METTPEPGTKKAKPQRESEGPVLPESQGGHSCRKELGFGEWTRRCLSLSWIQSYYKPQLEANDWGGAQEQLVSDGLSFHAC